MRDVKKTYFEVEGTFFTYQDGPIEGIAYTSGDSWSIVTDEGLDLCRDTIYLDRAKYVIAPRNHYQKKWAIERIEDLIGKYQIMFDDLSREVILKKDIFRMKLFMIETSLTEYKSLKYSYFSGNALKFILF